MADLYLQDAMSIELDDLTLDVERGLFKFEQGSTYSYEKKDNVWTSVTLERNLTKTEYSRAIYTAFDLMSDIGGLSGIISIGMDVLVGMGKLQTEINKQLKMSNNDRDSTFNGGKDIKIGRYCRIRGVSSYGQTKLI